jgi:RNA polymerase sigma-70 factor (ECF subfamily)
MNKFERQFKQKGGIEFSKFYNEQYPKLVLYLNNWTNNIDLSEDIASEAFMQCLKKIDTFDSSKSQVHTWLYTIAKNMTIKKYKDDKKLPTVSMDKEIGSNNATLDMFLSYNDTKKEAIKHTLLKRKADVVRKCIKSLPDKQKKYRTVLRLREIDAMSYEEIAKYLDLNLSTVKSQIKKGREIIKKNTEKELYIIDQIGIDDISD